MAEFDTVPPTPAGQHLHTLQELEFTIKVHDLQSEAIEQVRTAIHKIADAIEPERFRGPLYASVYELAANALKALYKRVYFRYFIEELGLEEIGYTEWLHLFRDEVEEHQAEKFAQLCHDRGLFIEISGRFFGDIFRLEIQNDGVPSEVEQRRLTAGLERARRITSLEQLLTEGEDDEREGGGLGLALIMATLRGLGIPPENFNILVEETHTLARIDIPVPVLSHGAGNMKVLRQNRELLAFVWNLFQKIQLGVVRFDDSGQILACSRALLNRLGVPLDKAGLFRTLLPGRFVADIFEGKTNGGLPGNFRNYRIYVPDYTHNEDVLFNVSGYRTPQGKVNTMWQEISIKGPRKLSEGSLTSNVKIYNLIEPYVPSLVLTKAREMVQLGRTELPEEVREQTIIFTDLVGFTQKVESIEPKKIVELLNLALSSIVRSIQQHGGRIDKFMGDAVMAIFDQPLAAVRAAIELQNNFYQINELRGLADEEPLHLRIGISTGTVILANVGTEDRKDWTALGDTVNVASRLEKKAPVGGVLISDYTYRKLSSDITFNGRFLVRVKGKAEALRVYSLDSVRFSSGDKVFRLKLRGGSEPEAS